MDIYSENIYDSIKYMSDLEWQKKAWMGTHETDVSSFIEDYSMLFDSFGFDDFITGSIIVDGKPYKINLSDNLKIEMIKFKTMLESYKEKETDKEILEDPEWHKIVKQAQKIIELWNSELDTLK